MNVFDTHRRGKKPIGFEPDDKSDEFVPTKAVPGTVAKIEVMARRVELGLPLWHPDDR